MVAVTLTSLYGVSQSLLNSEFNAMFIIHVGHFKVLITQLQCVESVCVCIYIYIYNIYIYILCVCVSPVGGKM
jgi:hypothetical protein